MNKLPHEVLDIICKPLHQQEKIEVMRVCKTWKKIIETRHLYHTVRLCNQLGVEYLIKRFQEEQKLGYQVEYLIVECFSGIYDDKNNFTTLLNLMPNLRYFYHRFWNSAHHNMYSPVQPFCSHIEHLAIHSSHPITTNFIFYNRFDHIKKLYIPGKNIFDPPFFTKLSKLTTLTELTLDKCGITLTFFNMDFLHKHLKALESLIIFQLKLKDDTLPSLITPATALRKLHLSTIQPVQATIRMIWLDYFSKKYPNLSDFKSKHTYNMFSEDANKSDISQGYALLFNQIGFQLKRLDLQIKSLPSNFFTLLDNSDCRLEYLKLCTSNDMEAFKGVSTSKQAESIQTLDISFDFVSNLTWLKSMTGLRTLAMTRTTRRRSPQLNALINVCPSTLETLELCETSLSFGSRPSYHTLKTLKFTNCMFYEGLAKFISENLEQLHTLKFLYCTFMAKYFSTLALPTHSLSHFEMLDSEDKEFFRILVVTSKDDKERIYRSGYRHRNDLTDVYNSSVPSLFPPTKSFIYESQTDYHFTLKCASVANVVL